MWTADVGFDFRTFANQRPYLHPDTWTYEQCQEFSLLWDMALLLQIKICDPWECLRNFMQHGNVYANLPCPSSSIKKLVFPPLKLNSEHQTFIFVFNTEKVLDAWYRKLFESKGILKLALNEKDIGKVGRMSNIFSTSWRKVKICGLTISWGRGGGAVSSRW